uniref:Orc1-like AAA ATPase domain-containing protein n=1 Tax=Thermogemmatispora argillosa TaxID=2045280 RepID=A0A455SYB3_9CHLR|nr:hypothetical protein KTA_02980 [Thermogemmatispora argillosa]
MAAAENRTSEQPLDPVRGPQPAFAAQEPRAQAERQATEEQRLRSLAVDAFSRAMLRDRLKSFVGRNGELQELRRQISELLATGGYLAITGAAAQGKSSVMAKLVDLSRSGHRERPKD